MAGAWSLGLLVSGGGIYSIVCRFSFPTQRLGTVYCSTVNRVLCLKARYYTAYFQHIFCRESPTGPVMASGSKDPPVGLDYIVAFLSGRECVPLSRLCLHLASGPVKAVDPAWLQPNLRFPPDATFSYSDNLYDVATADHADRPAGKSQRIQHHSSRRISSANGKIGVCKPTVDGPSYHRGHILVPLATCPTTNVYHIFRQALQTVSDILFPLSTFVFHVVCRLDSCFMRCCRNFDLDAEVRRAKVKSVTDEAQLVLRCVELSQLDVILTTLLQYVFVKFQQCSRSYSKSIREMIRQYLIPLVQLLIQTCAYGAETRRKKRYLPTCYSPRRSTLARAIHISCRRGRWLGPTASQRYDTCWTYRPLQSHTGVNLLGSSKANISSDHLPTPELESRYPVDAYSGSHSGNRLLCENTRGCRAMAANTPVPRSRCSLCHAYRQPFVIVAGMCRNCRRNVGPPATTPQ
eukprot:284817238_2